ncbi:G-patch domain-containing protein [Sporodiniella umbellata]|nr:G-patch domain-containing protein [Sporodiniella umbellata]
MQKDDLFDDGIPRDSSASSGSFDWGETSRITMETHIPESNVGYKMLQRMGWKAGKGLGTSGQGRVDPVRVEMKDETLGLGKAYEYEETHTSSTAKRKALDSEKQLEETEVQKVEREHRVEKKQAIRKELEQVKRVFYCELCDKQYSNILEYDQHLQSYDHHHKKRFKDMKEATRNSAINQSEKEKRLAKEKKREEREAKRMQDAMQQAIQKNAGTDRTIPKPTQAPSTRSEGKGGWSSVTSDSNIRGGWSSVSIPSSSKGGWSSLPTESNNEEKAKSIPTSTTNKGGWADVASVPHTNSVQSTHKSSVGQWAPIEPKVSIDVKPLGNHHKPAELKNISTDQGTDVPKKVTFGLKKTGGFQFGLKKK